MSIYGPSLRWNLQTKRYIRNKNIFKYIILYHQTGFTNLLDVSELPVVIFWDFIVKVNPPSIIVRVIIKKTF